MDTILAMRAFIRVAEAGSFTAAAQSLDISTATLSRAIVELETHLHTRLLNRSTRKVSVTDEGGRYLERCRTILADLDEAEEEARGARKHPAGVLKIHSFSSIGQHYVLPAVSKYRELYPDVKIELTLSQQMPNLFEGSSDVAVVTAPSLPDSDLIAYRLGSTYSVLCASPDYIRVHGAPQVVADLRRHECLTLKAPCWPADEWLFEGPQGSDSMIVGVSVQVNIVDALVEAVQQGMGIGMLPMCAAVRGLRDGKLARVLPNHTLQRMNIYTLYPSRRFVDMKTRAWLQLLRSYVPGVIACDVAVLARYTTESAVGAAAAAAAAPAPAIDPGENRLASHGDAPALISR